MEPLEDLEFVRILREHGLQITYQRLAIYRALYETKMHPSAEALYHQVRKQFPVISLGTVYKTLEKFHEVGLIQKVGSFSDVGRYDSKTNHHHHAVCMKCNGIMDIEAPEGADNISLPAAADFQILRHHIVLHGYCENCKE